MDDDENLASVSEAGVLVSGISKSASIQGTMSAYFDRKLTQINYKTFDDEAARMLLDQHKSLNVIYTSDEPLKVVGNSKKLFVPVIDVIGDAEVHTVWLEEQITFNPGFTPHQFFSDEQIDAAASGANPEITIAPTGVVYRCSLAQANTL